MNKKIIFAILVSFLFAGYSFAWEPVRGGQNEINLYGGVSVSDTSKNILGADMDIGGSGFSLGFTALAYLNPYIAAGIDLSYTDNNYGNSIKYNSINYSVRSEHIAPMFTVKLQLLPRSPVRLYIPLGVGVDFARLTLKQSDLVESTSDSSAGIALMAGVGVEVELSENTFAGVEGRYMYSDFFGRGSYDISHTGVTNILFKVGLRFDNDGFL